MKFRFCTAIFAMLLYFPIVSAQTLVLEIDFSSMEDTEDAKEVLRRQGFLFKLDTQLFDFSIRNGRLYVQTHRKGAVLFGKVLQKPIENPLYAVIEWGVERFPQGADWERGNNRLPIGLFFVLGKEKLPSGIGFLAPAAPSFLCPFIGEKEETGKRYLGKLYHAGGRYYCVSNELAKLVVTRFDIAQIYQKEFAKKTPALTAFAFQINTKNTDGYARSFIKSLRIYAR